MIDQLENLCPEGNLSSHYIGGSSAVLKSGKPDAWEFKEGKIITDDTILKVQQELLQHADSLIEQATPECTIVQIDIFRVLIIKKPLSTNTELVIVRNNYVANLQDYNLSEKIAQRLSDKNGVLIAGAPGQGKSTFVSAFIEEKSQNNIIKTVESPRDLIVPKQVTQLANTKNKDEIRDILLLSRPDITCIDEIRHKADYGLFADLRLCGIGCFGVIHATQPIDAIARFVRNVDMGSVAHILDTVIFIQGGAVKQVLDVRLDVKVPQGLKGKELTRPVITVSDLLTGQPLYELYSFADQIIIKAQEDQIVEEDGADLRAEFVQQYIQVHLNTQIKTELEGNAVHIYVPKNFVHRVTEVQPYLEKKVQAAIHIHTVQPKEKITFEPVMNENSIGLRIATENTCTVYINDEYLLCGKPSKKGLITIKSESPQGKRFLDALKTGKQVIVYEHVEQANS